MVAIRYETPRSVSEAVRLMAADPGARVLAGGTDLLVQFRTGVRQPSAFVDVKRIPELMSIAIDAHGLRLGAATPAAVIGEHAELRRLWQGPRRIFLVVRRPRGQSVVAALPAVDVHELGQYGARWLYTNRAP